MKPEIILNDLKREYGELFRNWDVTNLFIDILNRAIRQVANDIKVPTKTLAKEVTSGVYKLVLPDDLNKIVEVFFRKKGEKDFYKLQEDNISTLLGNISVSGFPRYFGVMFDEKEQFLFINPTPDVNGDLLIYYKHIPKQITTLGDDIPLPPFTKQAVVYYVFSLFAYNFNPPREQYYLSLYLNEINQINANFAYSPKIVGRKQRIVFYQEY